VGLVGAGFELNRNQTVAMLQDCIRLSPQASAAADAITNLWNAKFVVLTMLGLDAWLILDS
jgi:hypothetical protein